ncbi:MAG: dihydroneopterin aldolase [Proteobacteria bacterium]|nr:dihydroneopterin aldolase [Cystobacterineae bacterium]MCL2259277.1 dihydroneopterin aldolase [Cystobacterineae bacterium]MCL2314333.1 dihydroneopterin aldolase [Pseudomonadota bacterium]
MGIIELEDMEFFARHGWFPEERTIGNVFRVDLRIEADLSQAACSDRLEDTINYQHVYAIVKREMEIPSRLLEHLCEKILCALYAELEGIQKATVKVSKKHPPLGGKVGHCSVIWTRERAEKI